MPAYSISTRTKQPPQNGEDQMNIYKMTPGQICRLLDAARKLLPTLPADSETAREVAADIEKLRAAEERIWA